MTASPAEVPAAPATVAADPVADSPRQKIKDGLVALSLANLCLAKAWYYGLWLDKGIDYYRKLPLTQVTLLGLVLNMLWVTAVIWLGIRAWRRCQNRWLRAAFEWLFLLLWLLPLDFLWDRVLHIDKYRTWLFLKHPAVMVGLVLLAGCVVWQRRRVVRLFAALAGIMSPLAFILLVRIALASFGPRHPPHEAREPALAPLSPARAGQPRVVWMVFDEADQRLLFDRPPASLRMPEFERLRHECLYCTNAYPPGDNTIESLPGLIAGHCVSFAVPKGPSELDLTLAPSGKVVSWIDLPSVFDSAREAGVNTALVGWFHPYRRVLARSLNYCSWYPFGIYDPVQAETLGKAMRNELECLAWNLHIRQMLASACRATLEDSLRVVTNATYGLVFMHLVPPHLPGVFDPTTGRFTILDLSKVTAYFNNLMLADLTLGKLREAMESSGQWDRSWVIVSADHSWRGSRIYDGIRDLRVPFLIKAPGAAQAAIYSRKINTVLTHDLTLAILRGDVTNQAQAVSWVDEQPAPMLPGSESSPVSPGNAPGGTGGNSR